MPQRKWSAEDKLVIVFEGLTPGGNVSEVCRRHKVSTVTYYRWRDAFLAGGKSSLQGGPSNREKELEAALQAAQAKIGEQAMEIDILKKRRAGARSRNKVSGPNPSCSRISCGPDSLSLGVESDILLCASQAVRAKCRA